MKNLICSKSIITGVFILFSLVISKKSNAQEAVMYYVDISTAYIEDCGTGCTPFYNEYWGYGIVDNNFTITIKSVYEGTKNYTWTIESAGTTTAKTNKIGNPYIFTNTNGAQEYIDVTVKFYAFPALSSNFSTTPNQCVSSETAKNYTFTTDIASTSQTYPKDSIKSITMQVSKNSFSSSTNLSLSLTSNTNSFSYHQLTGGNDSVWYGEDVYYRIKVITKSNSTLYGKKYGPFTFYRSITAPSLVSFDRSACGEDIIKLSVASTIASHTSNYKFRAKLDSAKEDTSNIFKLVTKSVSGQIVTLSTEDGELGFGDASKNYDIRVFGIELPDSTKNHVCVSLMDPYTIPVKPETPTITSTPVVVATVGTTTYNTTTFSSSDGKCDVTVTNYTDCETPLYIKYKHASTTQTSTAVGSTGTIQLAGLSSGDYSIWAVDNDNCPSDPVSVNLKAPAKVTVSHPTNNQYVSCHVNNGVTSSTYHSDGQISVSWTGGIPPYTISYTSGSTTTSNTNATISGLSAGLYTVKVTDKYSIYDDDTVTVHSSPEVKLTPTNSDIPCYNGEANITFTIQNSKGSNTYQLYNNSNILLETSSSGISAASFTFLNTYPAAQYSAYVASGGCMATEAFEVTSPDDIVLTATGSKIAAYGGSDGYIDIDANGGTGNFTYKLYNTGETTSPISSGNTNQYATVNNLSDGYYDVYVTDENACEEDTIAVRVRQPDAPLSLTYNQFNVDCHNNATGEIYPHGSGGWGHYQYGFNGSISGTDTLITGLVASTSTDTVFVTDSAGVTVKLPVSITEPNELLSSIDSVYNLLCFEDNTGSVKLDITGGTTPYETSTDSTNWISGDSVGNLAAYENLKLYVRDNHSCTTSSETKITQPGLLTVTTDTIIDAFCNKANGGIQTIVAGGTISDEYAYVWYYTDSAQYFNNPSAILKSIYSGEYQLVVNDDHDCFVDTTFLVSDQDGPKIDAYETDSVLCYGESNGKIAITQVSGGMPAYTYYVDDNRTDTITGGLANGSHLVRVVDQKGCKVSMYVTVNQPDSLQVYGTVYPPICHDSYDGYIIAVPRGGNGGYGYTWSTGDSTAVLDSLNSGIYNLVINDWKNCNIESSYKIDHPAIPKTGWNSKRALLCTGNTINVDGGDYVSWIWTKDEKDTIATTRIATLSETGNYILKLTDSDGCTGIDTFALEVSDTPLDAVLLLPDSAHVSEEVGVVDVTWPVPDSINWFYSPEVTVLDSNSWSENFTAGQEGIVQVTLRAWYDGCYSDSSQTIVIYYEEDYVSGSLKSAGALITGFRAYPNPNSGDFYIGVSLSEASDIILSLYSTSDSHLLNRLEYSGLDKYEIPYTLSGLKEGVYVIILQAGGEQQTLKLVIDK